MSGHGRDDFEDEREALAARLSSRDRIRDEKTIDALRSVPRHEFVPENRRRDAYADRPLPIGEKQTISAPHMVAIMADLLHLGPGDEVLEIGTGCGYHAAVTAEIVGNENVYSVEYHDALAESSRRRLTELGYEGVSIRSGDGTNGWADYAPYDACYLTCAPTGFPDAVIEQLRPGGQLLAPLGTGTQRLVLAEKRDDGTLDRERHGCVRFVPMQ
jgi:protein-L-isoaspartate(D-aspartate) O-methyltransferase